MFGLSPRIIKVLTDNPLNGGLGIPIDRIGKLTLPQVQFYMTRKEDLRAGREATKTMDSCEAAALVGKDGKAKGRAADGTLIRGRIGGKSKARLLLEAKMEREKKQKEEERKERKRLRAKRRQGLL